jgi:hypothetical protein
VLTDKQKWPPLIARVGSLLLLLFIAVLLSSGVVVCLGGTVRPLWFGWICVLGGIGLSVWSVDVWSRGIPVILAGATLSGWIMLLTGHSVNRPFVPIPRVQSTGFIILAVFAYITTARLSTGKLSRADQYGSFGVLGSFVALMTAVTLSVPRWELPTCMLLLVSLGLYWKNGRLKVHSRP